MNPLWLALDLPRLPLETHSCLPEPGAVVAAARIVVCDDVALDAGVAPGMGLAAARAIAPQLTAVPRDPAREVAALEGLACWAGSFTPRVVMVPPQALLLEIGGCLRYFGGVDNLVALAVAGCAEQGFRTQVAIAPTPQGALWLAQAGCAAFCGDEPMLATALDQLPLSLLPMRAQERLTSFGARRLADVRRLPRAGLARRIGVETLAAVARAYGEAPDPRRDFVFPDVFAQGLELPAPVESAGALLFAARRLTAALAGWLTARQAGVARCVLHLEHRGRPASALELGFASATRDAGRFERVLRERLERLALAAPVEGLRLVADGIHDLPGRSVAMFEGGSSEEGMAALVERLRARLGDERVHGLAVVADHRPEVATRTVPQGRALSQSLAPPQRRAASQGKAVPEDRPALLPHAKGSGEVPTSCRPRPFWLLPAPEPIIERNGRPWRNGPLRLLAGPERIESGWWDAGEGRGDARRDYFVALTADARWAWVFRELSAPGGWFLHGWFS